MIEKTERSFIISYAELKKKFPELNKYRLGGIVVGVNLTTKESATYDEKYGIEIKTW